MLRIEEETRVLLIEEADKVVLAEPEVSVLVIEAGTPGVKGDKGDPGEPLQFIIVVPSTVWTITHNLGRYPAAWEIYDTADTNYEAGAEYLNANQMRFTFSAAIAGRVVIF